jgi:hypothetical protein
LRFLGQPGYDADRGKVISLSCTSRGALDASADKLTLKERFIYAQAPVDKRTEYQL